MVDSARRAGVTEDFHVFAKRPVAGAITHDPGPLDIKYHTFKWRLLRDTLASLDYDYFVWLDSDTIFTRNPGDLAEQLLRGNRMWCQMESELTSPKMRQKDWWGATIPQVIDLYRQHGATGGRAWNTNGGMWIIRREHVAEFVHELEAFHAICLARGLTNTHDETPLAWIGQILPWVADPERNTNEATSNVWACDWMGTYSDRIPTGEPWETQDYMTGEKRMASPAIVHAMRSKKAMARGLNTTIEDNEIPPGVLDQLDRAAKCGRYLVAVWRIDNGQVLLDTTTNNWPKSDFSTASTLLKSDIAKLSASVAPATTPEPAERIDLGATCKYRGEELRTELCEIGCKALRKQIPVFACSLESNANGECAPWRWERLPTMPACLTCAARTV